jgi:hypothetical protein
LKKVRSLPEPLVQISTNTQPQGIDVQAELRLKTGAPGAPPKANPMPPKAAPSAGARPNQRHPAGIASKPETFGMSQREGAYGIPSPQFQATPTSHVSSPSHAKSPGFGFQGAMSPVEGRPSSSPNPGLSVRRRRRQLACRRLSRQIQNPSPVVELWVLAVRGSRLLTIPPHSRNTTISSVSLSSPPLLFSSSPADFSSRTRI